VEDALAANADVVLRIDVQGAATVRRMMPNAVSIFLVSRQPPCGRVSLALFLRKSGVRHGSRPALQTAECEAEMVQRLVSRKTETMVRHMLPHNVRQCRCAH
jgi:guanylate kinase